MKIPYEVTNTLVRGLEYYTETVFEIISDYLGAQSTVCGGGRYNNLSSELGGPSLPAVGFGFGIERTIMLLDHMKESIKTSIDVYFIPLDPLSRDKLFYIMHELRGLNISCEIAYSDQLKSQLKRANKFNARRVVIMGEEEYQKSHVIYKHMADHVQTHVDLNQLISVISNDLDLNKPPAFSSGS